MVPAFPGPLGSTPVRRGAAVVAVAGGALSLMGAAAPAATPEIADVAARSDLPVQAAVPEVLMVPAVQPVVPDTDVLDDPAPLVKAVQMAEEQIARAEEERVAAEARAAEEAERAAAEAAEAERRSSVGADCGLNTGQLGAVKDFVREAAEFLGCLYDVSTMHGVAGRAGTSDHPSGKAIDFMVDSATGDGLAACALRNMDSLGISYVIWEQRINYGSGWEPMEDRGGVTANHFDHVHVSFDSGGGGSLSGC
ncbi:hypothetical protein GCM10017691_50180 [Pseudonocardia petroleophila]|uniref:ARB-07466-like C-terminal domain-containing protein n=1 Tax=Pseudonocardia petroleophila TaxID=37331 RepID=A0A7G7MPX9_9PSEU|nr:hypothetical protein [Pseudonocardia petroleophila]QNG54840.1 hypothetical protein H6H00_13715 [Pseudonocardia petroleophila]